MDRAEAIMTTKALEPPISVAARTNLKIEVSHWQAIVDLETDQSKRSAEMPQVSDQSVRRGGKSLAVQLP